MTDLLVFGGFALYVLIGATIHAVRVGYYGGRTFKNQSYMDEGDFFICTLFWLPILFCMFFFVVAYPVLWVAGHFLEFVSKLAKRAGEYK